MIAFDSQHVLSYIRGGLIVSCQARGDNPLSGPQYMVPMARAAHMGGATGIRAEGPDDVRAIVRTVPLPMIGLEKVVYPDSPVYITPTESEVEGIIRAGAHIVAIDATHRPRPHGEPPEAVARLVQMVHDARRLAMADVSTLDEALAAEEMGFDLVATTLSGSTPNSPPGPEPDLMLVREAARQCRVPVIAEGRYWDPTSVVAALNAGAHAVVVGTAITNPMLITQRFVNAIRDAFPERGSAVPTPPPSKHD